MLKSTCIALLFFIFSFTVSYSQNHITLKGKVVTDSLELAVESATVYLIQPKDSSVVDYTISDKNGLFTLETKPHAQPVIFKVYSQGHQEFTKTFSTLKESTNFGTIALGEHASVLDEVVIQADPPIRIKKDTLEFTASSFKVRPDSNVEELLKQLPGVEIDANKNITVNGKPVNQVLINGQPFFGEDGKIAIQNLPSELIKKIQVSDTKTEEEEFTDDAGSGENASINLTIEEDKNRGVFGKFLAGGGTDQRYESSALISYFKNKRRISVLASSNNINATGFSMDEVFDNMGGGRNSGYRVVSGSNGNSSSPVGIIKSNLIGLNYTDEWFKGFTPTIDYRFTNSDSENDNKTSRYTVLPEGSILSNSTAKTTADFSGNDANLKFEYNIDSTTKLIVQPKFKQGRTQNYSNFNESSVNENNVLINESNALNTSETDNTNFDNNIMFYKQLKKKGRYFTTSFRNENSNSKGDALVNSATLFYDDTAEDDIRNQNTITNNANDKYSLSFRYIEPISDSLRLTFSLSSYILTTADDVETFDYDTATDAYTNVNALMTNYTTSSRMQLTPSVGVVLRKKKYYLSLSLNTWFIDAEFYSDYLSRQTTLDRNFVIPDADINFNYRLSKSKVIFASYHSGFWMPRADYFLEVANLENPLNTIIGNPDLRLQKNHNLRAGFQDYDYKTRSGYSIYSNMKYYDINIVPTSVYDESGKQTTTYVNIFKTYDAALGGNWNKTIKKDEHQYNFELGLNSNYSLNRGFTNGLEYAAKTVRISPTIEFGYEYSDVLTVRPSYTYSYDKTAYDNESINSASNNMHSFRVEATTYWPKNWTFGNDFGYTYNSNISGGFKKDFYLWNTSLAYSFYEDKMTLKVKVYDILNQNQSTYRTITPTTITDTENTVLKRYAMFSLLYKFERFGTKKK
ncbi:TonB-dependent receptor [Formosa sp. PL04]|uniref:TonB-dependent receptor n=1 Tax=Formosa sp. PL04 TaxID=3081755 RepID=UPI00298242B1|nr:TonB-dependent receptor [Formosa sp. PL04]MDW5291012.1 TonB-dependent receptor [Formosa sp. PL04]